VKNTQVLHMLGHVLGLAHEHPQVDIAVDRNHSDFQQICRLMGEDPAVVAVCRIMNFSNIPEYS
jgi:hypothetical protein